MVGPALRKAWKSRQRVTDAGLHHAFAVAVAVRISGFFLRDVCDEAFRGEEQAGDRGGVLESAAGHLGRVNNAGLEEVYISGGGDVAAVVTFAFPHFGNDQSALEFQSLASFDNSP